MQCAHECLLAFAAAVVWQHLVGRGGGVGCDIRDDRAADGKHRARIDREPPDDRCDADLIVISSIHRLQFPYKIQIISEFRFHAMRAKFGMKLRTGRLTVPAVVEKKASVSAVAVMFWHVPAVLIPVHQKSKEQQQPRITMHRAEQTTQWSGQPAFPAFPAVACHTVE
eukprot:COSAG05_NODE_5206_length_1236_cov_1.464380_1_plen_168_part_00